MAARPSEGPTVVTPPAARRRPVAVAPATFAPVDAPTPDPVDPVEAHPLDEPDLRRLLTDAVGDRLGRVVVVDRSSSTSAELADAVRADPRAWPDRSVLVADHQEAGRGRRGRTWTTPRGTAVTMSVVLRPVIPADRWGWLALAAGLAVAEAVEELTGVRAGVKWPNDVVVPGGGSDEVPGWGTSRKVAGVLGEVVPTEAGPVAVVGIGVNVRQRPEDLPVAWASSLAQVAGRAGRSGTARAPGREEVAAAVLRALLGLDDAWRATGGDAAVSGLAERCAAACTTLGARVRVELPGGASVDGVARSLSADGSLEVVDGAGGVRTVLAGDVHHVRAAGLH